MDSRRYSTDELIDGKGWPVARNQAPRELTWRHKMMVALMVHGTTDLRLLEFVQRTEKTKDEAGKTVIRPAPPPAPGEPLEADEAGRLVGLRKRYARSLIKFPIFKALLREERLRASPSLCSSTVDDEEPEQ